MSDISLDGKAAIVTGSAGGLGQAMAVALAEAGAEVLAVDIDGDRIGDTVAAAKDAAPRIHPWAADVSKDDDRAGIIAASAEQCGGVDVLINNAGIGQATIRADYAVNPLKPWEIEAEHLLNFHAVHSVAPLRPAAAALPTMRTQGKGKIVTVTTGLDTMLFSVMTAYGGAKAASEAYQAGLARELADTGITVNTFGPGGMSNTRMVPDRPGLDREKLVQPSVMGPPAVWLASDLSDGVTGRRFNASLWDHSLPPAEAAAKTSGPIAWTALFGES